MRERESDAGIRAGWVGRCWFARAPAAPSNLSCHGERVLRGSEAHSVDLKLTIDRDGRVGALELNDFARDLASDNELAVHACSLDTSLPDYYGRATWSGSLLHQRLALVDAFEGATSEVKIAMRAHSYSVRFVAMSSSYCGQMDFPSAVIITRGETDCSVFFSGREAPG